MQGHGHDTLGLADKVAPSPGQPARKGRRRVRPVAVLEGQDQAPAGVVIDDRRAGPLKDRPPPAAGAAKRSLAQGIFEGKTAGGTLGRAQEDHPVPALGAQRSGRIDQGAAAQALGRQKRIKGASGKTAENGAQPG